MGNEMKVESLALQGKIFSVDLVSYLGSTNYGWCVSKLPDGIWLAGIMNTPVDNVCSKTLQQFYFVAVNAPETGTCTIQFQLACLSDVTQVSQIYEVEVNVVPSNSEEFTKISENETRLSNIDIDPAAFTLVAYGLPIPSPILPDGATDGRRPTVMYGYPCGVRDGAMNSDGAAVGQLPTEMYGYPCGVQDAAMKYGYPCGAQGPLMKYGYPCMNISKDQSPYGVPYWN